MSWTKNGILCNKEVSVAETYVPSNVWSSELHNGYCCIYSNYIAFFSTQVEWIKLNGSNRTQMNRSVVVDDTTYYYLSVSGDYTQNDDVFVKPATFDASIVADDLHYMITNATILTNYRYYFDLSGVETYFEWAGATADGTVFDIRKSSGADPSHCGVLAYDLLKTPNPSITSMNQSGVDITRSMYIREHYNVYMAFVTTTPHDSQNPRGYDVQLAAEPGDSYSMAAAIRAYWDSQATKPIYIGVNGRAREVTDMYVGVNGRARKVTAIYVGVNGRAREVFKAT